MKANLWLWRLSNNLYASIVCCAIPTVLAAFTFYRRNRKPWAMTSLRLGNDLRHTCA